jgi:hypothetical protein
MPTWIPITPDTRLPAGTELLALRHRGPSDDRTGWCIIDPVIVQRVGLIAGEQHPNADAVAWYGHDYRSGGGDKPWRFYSHYLPLSDLGELPALPVEKPDPDDALTDAEFGAKYGLATKQSPDPPAQQG